MREMYLEPNMRIGKSYIQKHTVKPCDILLWSIYNSVLIHEVEWRIYA